MSFVRGERTPRRLVDVYVAAMRTPEADEPEPAPVPSEFAERVLAEASK